MVLFKILGGLLILVGLFFIFLFPDWEEFQSYSFFRTGLVIGIILLAIGIYLLIK